MLETCILNDIKIQNVQISIKNEILVCIQRDTVAIVNAHVLDSDCIPKSCVSSVFDTHVFV